MTALQKIAAVVLMVCLAGGCNKHDQEVKAHAEEEMELLHQQLEKSGPMPPTGTAPNTGLRFTKTYRKARGI